jgi:hypothetical protein
MKTTEAKPMTLVKHNETFTVHVAKASIKGQRFNGVEGVTIGYELVCGRSSFVCYQLPEGYLGDREVTCKTCKKVG